MVESGGGVFWKSIMLIGTMASHNKQSDNPCTSSPISASRLSSSPLVSSFLMPPRPHFLNPRAPDPSLPWFSTHLKRRKKKKNWACGTFYLPTPSVGPETQFCSGVKNRRSEPRGRKAYGRFNYAGICFVYQGMIPSPCWKIHVNFSGVCPSPEKINKEGVRSGVELLTWSMLKWVDNGDYEMVQSRSGRVWKKIWSLKIWYSSCKKPLGIGYLLWEWCWWNGFDIPFSG